MSTKNLCKNNITMLSLIQLFIFYFADTELTKNLKHKFELFEDKQEEVNEVEVEEGLV